MFFVGLSVWCKEKALIGVRLKRCTVGWNDMESTRRVMGLSLLNSLVRLFAHSGAHRKEVYVNEYNASISYHSNPLCDVATPNCVLVDCLSDLAHGGLSVYVPLPSHEQLILWRLENHFFHTSQILDSPCRAVSRAVRARKVRVMFVNIASQFTSLQVHKWKEEASGGKSKGGKLRQNLTSSTRSSLAIAIPKGCGYITTVSTFTHTSHS